MINNYAEVILFCCKLNYKRWIQTNRVSTLMLTGKYQISCKTVHPQMVRHIFVLKDNEAQSSK